MRDERPPAPPWSHQETQDQERPAGPPPWTPPPSQDETYRDPHQVPPYDPRQDPQRSWSPPPGEPAGWGLPPVPPPDAPSAGEQTLSLSEEPWNEPRIWQPPPPRKRKPPYLLITAGVVAVAAVALAIIFWPATAHRSDNAGSTVAPSRSEAPTQPEPTPTDEETSSPTASGDLTAQARDVDALLGDMSSTRSALGTAVENGCSTSDLQDIRSRRESQLARARDLDVDALDDGPAMRDALVQALQASLDSNQTYLDRAPGCPTDSDPGVADANTRASNAKRTFLSYWNANAAKAGLTPRTEDQI
ncbi:hypothetical protein [Actinomadura parmotrematis]|uniref:DUF5667 domain-containing protein n=1 Tax=Actinomadura parmotrematis TaxID=2864039 RepID=A0ABS7FY05_9ACTN|nr:hypothetical protein [Actinomadura parmotrematis]MBW8485314.1 hypothetical protein [Actinomadura parmotrematis]